MKDNFIKKNYLKKIELITKYNQYYYNENSPLVTDQEYDEVKNEIIKLEEFQQFEILKI